MSIVPCPRCGAPNRPGAKFCKECRAPLPLHVTMKTCPKCQAPNRMNARFCAKCGHVFSAAGTDLLAGLRQVLQSNPARVILVGGVALAAVLCVVGVAVLALVAGNSQTAERGTDTAVPPMVVAAGSESPTLSASAPQTPSVIPPQPTAGASATSTSTPTTAADGLDLAKRGTVLIVVPLDATPGKTVSGSGSAITQRGHILTNNHLFVDDSGNPYNARGEIYVGFPPRDNLKADVEIYYQATLVRADTDHDLALIRITATKDGGALPADLGLSTIPIGNSDKLDSGDQVTILGYPGLGGDTLTLTRGTIAGFLLNEGYIKTDAEINPGNSGGPSLNSAYEQIGVASAVFVSRSQTIPGKIGWIRPISYAKPLIDLAKREAGE